MTGMVRRKGQWLAAKVGDNLMMMSSEHEEYLGLNEVGACIWNLLETPQRLEDIVKRVVEEYETTPEQVHDDAMKFLEELVRRGAATMDASSDLHGRDTGTER